MLAAWPDQVLTDKIATFTPSSVAMDRDFKWLNVHRPAPFAWAAQDLHPSGAAGDATQASAEKGRALLTHGANAFCELLQDVEKFDVKQFGNQ
jgi:creatinine amidohydrolase